MATAKKNIQQKKLKFKVRAKSNLSQSEIKDRLVQLNTINSGNKFTDYRGVIDIPKFSLTTKSAPDIELKGELEKLAEGNKIILQIRYTDPLIYFKKVLYSASYLVLGLVNAYFLKNYYFFGTGNPIPALLSLLLPILIMQLMQLKYRKNPLHKDSLNFLLDYLNAQKY